MITNIFFPNQELQNWIELIQIASFKTVQNVKRMLMFLFNWIDVNRRNLSVLRKNLSELWRIITILIQSVDFLTVSRSINQLLLNSS